LHIDGDLLLNTRFEAPRKMGGDMATDALKKGQPHLRDLAMRITTGDRRALARAITLIESTRADHRDDAIALLDLVGAYAGNSLRLALTGAPGVGKSTFIENFGLLLADAGERLVVLAVDATSRVSGGSILGDKTRMQKLARHPNVFIRPSPAQTTLGGVARRTRESLLLAEANGATVVMVETVGVGQSETAVADMTDVFALLVGPAAGDELQGVKRGVMEMADFIVVTKADGDLTGQAMRTAAEYAGALRLLRRRAGDPAGIPTSLAISSINGDGLAELWARMRSLDNWRRADGWRDRRRADQNIAWMETEIERGLSEAFNRSPAVAQALPQLRDAVANGSMTPEIAANRVLALFATPFKRG
jgi:LAO/AO transport system kinase